MTKIKDFIRGDSRNIPVLVVDTDGVTPLNLTGGTVSFTLNASNAPTDDSAALITKDITSHTDPTNGKSNIPFAPTDTTNIAPGTYYYDLQFTDNVGNKTSKKQDTFTILADITRR